MSQSPSINITFPVLNEAEVLKKNILIVYNFLKSNSEYQDFEITISDNKSTDETEKVGLKLEEQYEEIKYLRLNRRGRNIAVRTAWVESKAEIVSYMDIDLSTNLKSFFPLIDAIAKENYDLAIGNRLGKNSAVENRSLKREILSRGYNLLVRILFGHHIKDHQCGFKAMRRSSFLKINQLIPDLKAEIWFLDTELILKTLKNKMTIKEIEIEWEDETESTRVQISNTVKENLKGLYRLWKEFYLKR